MGKPYQHKQQSVYLPTLEELEEERNDLLKAQENGMIVASSLCRQIQDYRAEIYVLKAEIRRLRAEVGERDRLIEKLSLKKEKGDK